jgi:ATP-binding cassette subfamily F protein 3
LAAATAAASEPILVPAAMETETASAPSKNGKESRRVNPIKLKQMQDRLKFVEEEIPRLEALIGGAEQLLGVFVSMEETARVSAELDGLRERHASLTAEWEDLMGAVS